MIRARILCIDDEPLRYAEFYVLAQKRGFLVTITDHPTMVQMYLDNPLDDVPLVGVCLDHDMPHQDGFYFANQHLISRNFPVAIVSVNPAGASKIQALLEEYETPCGLFPAATRGWELEVLEFFGIPSEASVVLTAKEVQIVRGVFNGDIHPGRLMEGGDYAGICWGLPEEELEALAKKLDL